MSNERLKKEHFYGKIYADFNDTSNLIGKRDNMKKRKINWFWVNCIAIAAIALLVITMDITVFVGFLQNQTIKSTFVTLAFAGYITMVILVFLSIFLFNKEMIIQDISARKKLYMMQHKSVRNIKYTFIIFIALVVVLAIITLITKQAFMVLLAFVISAVLIAALISVMPIAVWLDFQNLKKDEEDKS